LDEFKQFVRRAEKFLPEKITQVQYQDRRTALQAQKLFNAFIRDTDRSRLAADVEIKVCLLYGYLFVIYILTV
jgi:hypothetical protein